MEKEPTIRNRAAPAARARAETAKGTGLTIFKLLTRLWIPVVILVVVLVAGFTVSRVHNFFGSEKREGYSDTQREERKPYNPKQVTYEVFGPPGTIADISYFDVDAEPRRVDQVQLPWQLHITTTLPAIMGNLVAQGDSNSIGCRIVVDGVVKAERISNEVHAYTYCLVKSA